MLEINPVPHSINNVELEENICEAMSVCQVGKQEAMKQHNFETKKIKLKGDDLLAL